MYTRDRHPSVVPKGNRRRFALGDWLRQASRGLSVCTQYLQKYIGCGGVLREDFRPDSDVDVLVSFSEHAYRSLFDLVRMQNEPGLIFGHEVDLWIVSNSSLPRSRSDAAGGLR